MEKLNVSYYEDMKNFGDHMDELKENLDFEYFGEFESIKEIYEEFEYQGFTKEQVIKLTNARYGNKIEIISIENQYYVFTGAS